MINLITNTDSYKPSQWLQYPPKTEYIYSYIESRGGRWEQTVYLGMQAFLREYLSKPITMSDINKAEKLLKAHGVPFNKEGWKYILEQHNGFMPVKIMSAPEGTVMATRNVMATIVNTDPKCYWLTSYLETALLRAIWYPTTVATNSWACKQVILKYLNQTGDPSLINFKLHDFGSRGVSSYESAKLGGLSHMVNFMGTDTLIGIEGAMDYYDAEVCGFSIPAMEHSTVTSWGKDHEVDSYRNMMKHYAKPGAILACVSDSYDIYNACENIWGGSLKDEVIKSGATIVIRPDSGDPVDVVAKCLQILDKQYGSVKNDKGYYVINHVRVIQGDGIDEQMIASILFKITLDGYSADNISFGMGGALLQQVNRDTLKFAMKCSAICIDGKWGDVYKDPITDPGKVSKKGRLTLQHMKGLIADTITTAPLDDNTAKTNMLKVVFENGKLFNETTFDQIRKRANGQSVIDSNQHRAA